MRNSRGDQSGRWLPRALLHLAASLMLCAWCAGQTTGAVGGAFDREPIRRPAPSPTTRSAAAAPAPKSGFLDLQRTVLALGIVIGLILLVRWLGKRYFPAVGLGRASNVVRVLTRSIITPKQQVLLVQVGRRVLVVADNGTQMSALSEIVDPDEVASLVGQIDSGGASGKEVFDTVLNRANQSFERELAPQEAAPASGSEQPLAHAQGEITGLMDKVRAMSRQLGRS